MLTIRIHHKDKKNQAQMRDDICGSLIGMQAFIENDILVSDDELPNGNEPITLIVIGKQDHTDHEKILEFDVREEDMIGQIGFIGENFIIPKMNR